MVYTHKNAAKISALILTITLLFCSCSISEKVSQKSNVSMGSVVTIKTYSNSNDVNSQAQQLVLDNISNLDMLISKNNENAQLSKVNQMSGEKVVLDNELFNYIKKTADVFSDSDNKVSASSGALTELWGIDNDEFRLPADSDIKSTLPLCNDKLITFNSDDKSITTQKGQVINLGAVGKGIACDKAVESLKACPDIKGAIVSVGGSIATYGTINKTGKFTVGVRNPYGNENEWFATLEVGESFVSTSGSYEKTFELDGKKYHHILDLTTGYPVENNLVSVTIVADSGLISDALSTMCFALGEEKSQDILKKYNAQAVFVYSDKTVSVTSGIKDSFKITDNSFKQV